MELKSESYKIRKDTFYFRWNVKARILFEKMAGKQSMDPDDLTEEQAFMMAYAGTVSGMWKQELPFEMSYDEYLDYVDMDAEGVVKMFERMAPDADPDPEEKKKK